MRKKGAELVFLGELPDGEEVIDFYHAAGHLDTALAAAYGDTHPKRRAQFEKQRHVLLEDYKGVEKVIRSLVHLVSAPKKDCPRTEVFSAIGIECATRRSRNKVCRSVQEYGGSVQDSSNATHEEVRNAGASKAAKPFYPSALSCRAIASGRSRL